MKKNLTFKEIETITRRVFREFEKHEQRPWGVEATMIELLPTREINRREWLAV